MEKRVFVAIFLCFAVLALYQAYFGPPPTETVADAPQETVATPASPAAADAPAPVESAPEAPAAPAVQTLVADTGARDIVVETDTVRAVFSSAGATLKNWRLKRYLDETGAPLELVPQDLPPRFQRPFTLATDDPAISAVLATALFEPSETRLSLGSTAGTLEFRYRDASGLNARKVFHIQPEGKPYLVGVEAAVDIAGSARPATLSWGPAIGLGYSPSGDRYQAPRAVLFRDGSVERVSASNLVDEPRYDGELRFAGVSDHYFLSVALPLTQSVRVEYDPITLPLPDSDDTRALIGYSVGVPGAANLSYYMGPKDFDTLRAVDVELVRAIDFGTFAVIVVPLLNALKWINGFVGNYGWSIVVLTVLINIVLFPLRHRSMVSMRKMQALQPEVKAIQDRYKDLKITDPDRQKMNQEMMALYKQKGVNPASGCVPMLLTLPILLAFYAMLSAAIELRGAPFFGWVQDLSVHDPLFIWPLVTGVTMFVQQRMTPTTADPTQQKIFMLMPLMFTGISLWFPAGLVVYWFANNLMSIGQQYMTNRLIGVPVRPQVLKAPPKKVAGSRVDTPEGQPSSQPRSRRKPS